MYRRSVESYRWDNSRERMFPLARWQRNLVATVLVLGLLERLSISPFFRPETIIWTFGKWTEHGTQIFRFGRFKLNFAKVKTHTVFNI